MPQEMIDECGDPDWWFDKSTPVSSHSDMHKQNVVTGAAFEKQCAVKVTQHASFDEQLAAELAVEFAQDVNNFLQTAE